MSSGLTYQKKEKSLIKDFKPSDSENIKLDYKSTEEKVKRIRNKYHISELESNSKLSLSAAKEKYPDWYIKRIIKKQPKGS